MKNENSCQMKGIGLIQVLIKNELMHTLYQIVKFNLNTNNNLDNN
jgi:hypothetical protein